MRKKEQKLEEKKILSVVVPVYNNEKYLRTCIESILRQKYTELEIILVDDGSTDGSGQICNEYALKDSRIRVIQKNNEGACYARRDGALAAKGEYITFVDSDDWIDADMYEVLYGLLLEHEADIVTSGFIRNEAEEIRHDPLPEGVYEGEKKESLCANMLFHKEHNIGGIIMSVCNKIYHRALLIPYMVKLPADIHLWEDLVYVYPPFIAAEKVVVTHKCFYHYRKNMESTSNRFDPLEYEKIVYTLDAAREVYLQYSKPIQEAFDLQSSLILYYYLWRRAENKDHQYGTRKEMKDKIESISKDPHFSIPVQAVIQQIPLEREQKFLGYLLDGDVERAIRYCRYKIKQKNSWIVTAVWHLLGERRVEKLKKALRLE